MPAHRQSVPRFSLKRLLLSTTCIACGIGFLAFMMSGVPYVNPSLQTILLVYGALFGGGALIGGGIGLPFGRMRRGVVAGLVLMAVVFVLSLFPTSMYQP
jgi:hypothetical protein